MRHKRKGRKLKRKRNQRRALLYGLAEQIILHERITTTEARAKEARPIIERFVTRAHGARMSDRRQLRKRLGADAVKKLVDNIAPRFQNRSGGYVRITKLGHRACDAARMARIEFVS